MLGFAKSLMKGPELLARALIVVDQTHNVRYLSINKDITKLPNFNEAIKVASQLMNEPLI